MGSAWEDSEFERPTTGLLANGSFGLLTAASASICYGPCFKNSDSSKDLNLDNKFLTLFNDSDPISMHTEAIKIRVDFLPGESPDLNPSPSPSPSPSPNPNPNPSPNPNPNPSPNTPTLTPTPNPNRNPNPDPDPQPYP